MAKSDIVPYKKNGKTFYKFQAYLGISKTTGKRKSISRSGFISKKEAQITLDRLKYEFDHTNGKINDDITYREVFEMWQPIYATTVTESTLNRVLGIFKHHALAYFGDYKLVDIDVRFCQQFINETAERISDIRKVGNYVGLIFKYAMKLDFIQKNPMAYVMYPQKHSKQSDNYWTPEQLKGFLELLDTDYKDQPELRAYFRLAAVTGARKAELLALQEQDFSIKDRSITINKTVTRKLDNSQTVGKTKTTNSNRTLYLDDKTVQILSQWIMYNRRRLLMLGTNTNSQNNQLLFPNSHNDLLSLMKPNHWLSSIINKYHLKPITPHGLRHSVASALSESGASIKAIQLQLGDSSTDVILAHYVHVDNRIKQDTTKKLANFVGF